MLQVSRAEREANVFTNLESEIEELQTLHQLAANEMKKVTEKNEKIFKVIQFETTKQEMEELDITIYTKTEEHLEKMMNLRERRSKLLLIAKNFRDVQKRFLELMDWV